MTVAELIEKLKEFPPETPVAMGQTDSFGFLLIGVDCVQSAWAKDIDEMVWDERTQRHLHHQEDFAKAKEGEEGAYLCVEIS